MSVEEALNPLQGKGGVKGGLAQGQESVEYGAINSSNGRFRFRANDPVFTDLSRLQQRLGEWEVYRFDESNKYKCGGGKVVLEEEQKPLDYIEEL
ncbi:hypothetical protein Tco_0294793 [Tanacetum coccineum]